MQTIAPESVQTADTLALLAPLVRSLTDNKQQLGFRYAQWCTGAPTLEAATAATAMAQTELGHSRALLPVLDELAAVLPADGVGEERTVQAFACLDAPFASWAEFVAANLVLDGTLTIFIDSSLQSPFAPFQTRTRKMVEEERHHTIHGNGWVQKLARMSEQSRQEVAAAIRRYLPEALCWFGPAGGDLDSLEAAGMVDAGADELRRRVVGRLEPALQQAGVIVEALPWDHWVAATRRLEQP